MTKTATKNKTAKTEALAVQPPAGIVINLPESYHLSVDVLADDFSYTQLQAYAKGFFSMESLEAVKKTMGNHWPVFTPSHIALQVIDSDQSEYEQDDRPKLVLYFHETPTGLVLNKSRCELLTEMCDNDPRPKVWATHPAVSLEVGIYAGKAQIIVVPAKSFYAGKSDPAIDEANAKLGLG